MKSRCVPSKEAMMLLLNRSLQYYLYYSLRGNGVRTQIALFKTSKKLLAISIKPFVYFM